MIPPEAGAFFALRLAAQEEYLVALKSRATLGGDDGQARVDAARRRLALWSVPAAELRRLEASGQPMTRDEAREAVYGMPFAEFKARHQAEATPEQLAAFEARTRSS